MDFRVRSVKCWVAQRETQVKLSTLCVIYVDIDCWDTKGAKGVICSNFSCSMQLKMSGHEP